MKFPILRFLLVATALLLPGLLRAQQTFDPANPPASATPPTEVYNEYTGSFSHQKGPKTVLVFLVQPSDGAAWTSPTPFATLDAQLNTASSDYYNYSYRQVWFGPKRRNGMDIPRLVVTPVLTLPGTAQYYKDSFGALQDDCLAAARALGGGWATGQINDAYNFDRWVVMSNTKLVNSTGLAYVGGRFSWTNGSLSGGVAEHELGHNWGVFHANAWSVPAGEEPRSPLGGSVEYGDGWDLMGGNVVEAGFNIQMREDLGFLERSRNEILDVTTSGTYRLYDYIHPDRRQTASLVRGLLIPMSSFTDGKRIFLGFRDVASSNPRAVWNLNSVTVHTVLGASGSSRIDTTPGSSPIELDDVADSSLRVGRTYSEGPSVNGTQMYGGFHITPTARGADTVNGQTHEWIDVVVNYQNAISGNLAPLASFAQTEYPAAAGSPLTFAVTASDPNGDALAYDWNFGDGTTSSASSASQTKTWAAAGLYLVSCTVSDMKGATASAAAWVNVGSQAVRAADNPSATFGGIDYELFSGSWTTLPDFSQLLPASSGTVSTISIPPGTPANGYAVRYTGFITVPATDTYQFTLTSEDGSRLKIGGTTVVTNDGQRSTPLAKTGNIALAAGTHAFTVEFFNRDDTASINLQWRTATTASTSLVASDFSRTDWLSNSAPAVSVLNPVENTEFVVGASVLLQATATDSNGIARVQYYAGGAYIGESTTAPYDVTWSNLSPGTKQVQAYATDTTGRTTLSSARTFTVVSPPPHNLISINFAGDSSASFTGAGVMNVDDMAGAIYQSAYWTTLRATRGYGSPFIFSQMNATTAGLQDQTGAATTASITTEFIANNVLSNTSPADTGNSRMMRSYAWRRQTTDPGSITLNSIPYASYDVYVYFDALNTDGNDSSPSAYTINGVTKYGQNAASLVAGKGDFPNYATWTDYKEATATSVSAPIAERLGNYVVFRNQSGPTFTLTVGTADPVNGIQIVDAAALVVNSPPVVAISRPIEQVITLADTSADLHLTGTASDDGLPSASLTTTWSMVSGPGTAVFSAPSAPATRVTFPLAGRYVLRFTASDGSLSSNDEVQVYVATNPETLRSNGLAGYWKFDEGTGTAAADSSGNGRNATCSSGTSWNANGYAGSALSHNTGSASYAYGSAHPSAFTVAAWIRLDEMPVNADRFLFDTVNNTTQYLRVYVGNGSRKISVRSKRTTDGIWTGEYLLPSNTWVHVAVSYDAGNVANDPVIYINGVSVPVTEVATPIGNATSQATGRIGVSWKGSIDEFRLYSRLVPATEMAALAVAGAFNAAPVISAGADKDTAAAGTITLDGTASDDGLPALPGVLSLGWTKDSGPSGGSFGDGSSAVTSFTTVGSGAYVLRLTADDGSIVVSRTMSVTATSTASAYDNWKTTNFPGQESNAAISGDTVDGDGDGLPNLVEFALGGDPDVPNSILLPDVAVDGANLTLTYDRPKALAGIAYVVEASSNLASDSWSNSGVTTQTIADHGATETVQSSLPLSGTRGFLRLRVSIQQ